jgi:VWFA-related protein
MGKLKGCLFLLFVIAFGLVTVVTTGCSGGEVTTEASNGSDTGQNSSLEVLINQIDRAGCPTIKAYVSATDQDGTVIPDLTGEEFSVFEDEDEQLPIVVDWPATVHSPISVCLALDYSGSMADEELDAVEAAAVAFVGQMTSSYDWGEIIKFAGEYPEGDTPIPLVEVFQEYTDDKQLLIDAIYEGWTLAQTGTALYDAIYLAVSDTALQEGRRGVIAITDGRENCSDHDKDDVIDLAVDNEVPVFTIRLGWAMEDEVEDLKEIAELSGGKYFNAPELDDLEEIYLQISEMLVLEQYIISYDSALIEGGIRDLEITLEYQGLSGSDLRQFTACLPEP